MLEELAELVPARVGLHRRVVGAAGIELGEDLVAHQIERRHAGVTAARDVDGGQVERQAEQVVPERAGDELVDLVGDLVDRAEHDLAGGGGAMRGERERIEERVDQADRVQNRLAGERIDDRRAVSADLVAVDVLVQHRVAEAIDGVRELGRDRRVEMDVVVAEQMDVRRHLARELLEHQVLVLRLGAELGDLEQPLAVPFVVLDDVDGIAVDVDTVGDRRSTPGSTQLSANDVSPLSSSAWIWALTTSIWRLCSAWKMSWIAVSAMFSLARPSPAM